VIVASRRPPAALAPQARAIGPTVIAKSLRDALEADTIILAVPFGKYREVAKALPSWKGKTVIDAMNTLVPPEELDGRPSSAFVAKSFTGAKFVKGFNHLVAATLATDPIVEGGHRVVFLSSDDEDAIAPVEDLAKELGFAPVKPGRVNDAARWCTHAPRLGSAHLPGFVQEGAVIDLRLMIHSISSADNASKPRISRRPSAARKLFTIWTFSFMLIESLHFPYIRACPI
jgi:hypothetical protein